MSKLWLTETENLIEAIEQEKQSLDEEYEKVGRALAARVEELAHWMAVLQSYRERQKSEAPQPSLFLQEANIDDLTCCYRIHILIHISPQQGEVMTPWKVTGPDDRMTHHAIKIEI